MDLVFYVTGSSFMVGFLYYTARALVLFARFVESHQRFSKSISDIVEMEQARQLLERAREAERGSS